MNPVNSPLSIAVIQSCDPVLYLPLLEVTGPGIRKYCLQHKYDYHSFIGIKRGFTPRHAAFNRIYLLLDEVQSETHDWALYLDVDCYIYNFRPRLEEIIFENMDKAFIFCRGKLDGRIYDFNNGAFFINLKHPKAKTVLTTWKDDFEQIWNEEKLALWTDWSAGELGAPGDQRILQSIIKKLLESGEDVHTWLRVYDGDQWQRFNYSGPFIRQCLRSTGLSIVERIRKIKSELKM
jgi:hypothetical protein